jgi:alpha-glucoside transport system permease protein
MVVPLQMALIPILRLYTGWRQHRRDRHVPGGVAGPHRLRPPAGHLPAAQLHRVAALVAHRVGQIDGADHFTIFWRLIIPLSVPVLAAFAIFQFLWVWNDYAGGSRVPRGRNVGVLTVALADLAGRGEGALNLLPAGAFITMVLPLVVFFSLQRFFVRGLTAGSVKG